MRLQPYEIEVDVDMLCLDSTSFRQLTEANAGDPKAIGEAIEVIVAERGKMHNPVTGSGGILMGTIRICRYFLSPTARDWLLGRHARLAHADAALDRPRCLEVDPSSPQVKGEVHRLTRRGPHRGPLLIPRTRRSMRALVALYVLQLLGIPGAD